MANTTSLTNNDNSTMDIDQGNKGMEVTPSVQLTEEADQSMDSCETETVPSPSVPPSPSQENIVAFAEKYSLNLASRRFNVPVSTIKKWMKSSQVPMKPKYNSPGQGRKISYSAELEYEMAEHIRDLLAKGERVTTQSICSYARSRVQEEIPDFAASSGWAHRFLARNNIDLTGQKEPKPIPKDTKAPDGRGRPLSYSVETDQAIANYVRQKLADGYSLTNSQLRRYAKDIIIKENSKFTGSASWAQNFLHRHKLNLVGQDPKDATPTSPSPTLPSLSIASPSTSLLSAPLLNTQAQYANSVLSSSPHLTSTIPGVTTMSVTDTHLSPATEMHIVASSAPGYPNAGLSDAVMSLPAEYATDDPMKQALAILTGENIDTSILSAAQVASLQSTLSELTSDTVSLVDLLNTAQQLHEQSGESGSAALITHALDSAASGLFLGINPNSDVFGSGLTGAAATQVNPNTQTPTVPNPPRPAVSTPHEMDANPSSRPLSYAKETDQLLAKWVQEQQAAGKKVTFASLRAYAKDLVSTENPNFNASVGWVTPFLLRHGLDLSINKKKSSRKSNSPQCGDMSEEGQTQPTDISKQAADVHQIMQEEQQIMPEQMMVPVQAVTSVASHETPIIPPPVTSCSPATLEGIRAVLEQGMQNLAAECSQTEQIQFTQFQEPALTLSQTPTSLAQATETFPQIVNNVLSEDQSQGTCVPTGIKDDTKEEKLSVKKRSKGQRNRHRLSEKLDVVRLMREHSLAPHYVCRMLGIANSTLAGWIKLVQQKGAELEALSLNKKRSNLSGQGRPLTYSKEKDDAIAQWVQTKQKSGIQVMPGELAKYAQSIIREENPNFTASSGWSQKFLQRHGLQLSSKTSTTGAMPGSSVATSDDKSSPAVVEDQHEIPAAVQTEEVIAHEYSQERPYSEDTEKQLVAWVKENVSTNGSLSLQALCRYAEELVISQNPMFVASLSWAFMFLYTHNLLLDPKPNVASVRSTPTPRKRTSSSIQESSDPTSQEKGPENTPKKPCQDVVTDVSVSPSTGHLCEALLALSSQSQEAGQSSNSSVQAVLQVALRALHQQQQKQQLQVEGQVAGPGLLAGDESMEGMEREEQEVLAEGIRGAVVQNPEEAVTGVEKEKAESEKTKENDGSTSPGLFDTPEKDNSSNTYFGKPAREFSVEEKEEVVRYANATTLQKAAIKYGVAAPTVWRWRVELKLHQPKYSAMQKKYIIKFAETNSLKEAAQRYGITGKTIQNWRKALQADGELSGDVSGLLTQESQTDVIESTSQESQSSEVVFHFIVDGGEVVEVTGTVAGNSGEKSDNLDQGTPPANARLHVQSGNVPLEVTNEVDIENVGMEYDVVSSEGHVAKPRCTPQEKVQILQYALDHSIKEASQKFGVSPGTLYYWKRSRSCGKENSKESLNVANPASAPNESVPPVINVQGETNMLASNSGDVVPPEQFIATSDASSSASETQTATIHTLSQALAGMGPDALQHLNPDLTLLQAVSSLLSGGVGGEGGGGEGVIDENTSKRLDSHCEGISSPTEVLVQPFPPQKPTSSTQEGSDSKDDKKEGEVENQVEELMPQVVSEEVVALGESTEVTVTAGEKSAALDREAEDPLSCNDVLTPIEPVSAIALSSESETTTSTNPLPSSEPESQDQLALGAPVELEVLTFPPQSSLTVPPAGVVVDIPPSSGTSVSISPAELSESASPSMVSTIITTAGDNQLSDPPAEGTVKFPPPGADQIGVPATASSDLTATAVSGTDQASDVN